MKQKKILVIGAGESCCGIIETIKKMGYLVVVIGNSENLPANKIADYYFVLEDNDVAGTISICNKLNVNAIVPTPVERTLRWMGEVANELGLIFLSRKSIENFRDKFKMKMCFQNAGINCAKGILISKEEIYPGLLKDYNYPLIMKPLDAYASRGVLKIQNYKELKSYLEETSGFSSNGKVIIEEYIGGREFNAEGVCYQGESEIYAIVEKIRGSFPHTIEMGHIIPPAIKEDEERIIVDTISSAIRALGMNNGAFNAEIKLYHEEGYVIEIAGRLAGDFIISHLIEPTTGQDMNKAVVNISLGLPPAKARRKYLKHGIISFFNLPKGKRIKNIKNFRHLHDNSNVIWAHIFFQEGDTIPEVIHMGQRSGFVIVTSNTRKGMFSLAEKTKKQIIDSIEFE
jgi:biotin carboxylase